MADRQTLHFLACGHVDDGKSTLIGRLLHDIGAVPEDQLNGAMTDGVIDFSRLTDGLEDERAQGITIDVAYRYFRHGGRHYRIADTPGHTQYTRNMAVAAANSDCALILVDAAHGVREQTVRHSRIAAFFGIRDFAVIVNKMDLTGYGEARFREIEAEYRKIFGPESNDLRLTFIPASALRADNITTRSKDMPWYEGLPLADYLAALQVPAPPALGVRLPVQSIVRIGDTRCYQGMLEGGDLKRGDDIGVAGTDAIISVSKLYHGGREVDSVRQGQAISLITDVDADLSRGSVLYGLSAPVLYIDAFAARLLWLDPAFERCDVVNCVIKIHNREEQAELRVAPGEGPMMNAHIFTAAKIPVDLYAHHRATGLFLVIQPESERVIGVGVVAAFNINAPLLQRQEVSV